MRTLYVTDLDGTLLNKQSRISETSICVINRLIEQGILFTYATARSLTSALPVTKGLAVEIPIIAYNGTFIVNPKNNEILYSLGFTAEQCAEIIAVLKQNKVSPMVYAFVDGVERVSWCTENENDGIRYYLQQRQGDKRFRPLQSEENLYAGEIFYFSCIGEPEQLRPVYETLVKHPDLRCTFQQEIYRSEYWCEIMPKRATKAEAIGQLKERLQCDRVIVFGDAQNDIPMFEIADACYAVENAAEELKAIATAVIGSNEQDGVAKWLLEHTNDSRSEPIGEQVGMPVCRWETL